MTEQSRIVRILDRAYTMSWREGRLEDVLRSLDDDFEWVAIDFPGEGVRRGPESVVQFFRDWLDVWEDLDYTWEMEELDPERVLALVHARGRSRAGVPGEMHFGQIWEMRDGRFTRMTMYTDVEQARRAAGLTDE